MPIKGLTDRGQAFPEIGQIRKGAKKDPNKNQPGADLPYFRIEFAEGEQKAEADFRKVYGDKPTKINIILPFNEVERMWDAWLEAYTAGRMVARSDGEFITYQLDDKSDVIVQNGTDKSGQPVKHPKDNIAGHDQKGNPVKFKHTGRLKVIIPELARAAYITIMTTSIHDIGNISDQIAGFKELNNGQLAGIPFVLRRRAKMISTPNADGTRARRKKSLISIEADEAWVRAKFGQIQNLALPDFHGALLPGSNEIEDEVVETDFDEDEIIDEAGAEVSDSESAELPSVELIDPMGSWAVDFAAKKWNMAPADAAKEISRKALGKKIDRTEFIQIVEG